MKPKLVPTRIITCSRCGETRKGDRYRVAPPEYWQAMNTIIHEGELLKRNEGLTQEAALKKLHQEHPELWAKLHSIEELGTWSEHDLCFECAGEDLDYDPEEADLRVLAHRGCEEFLEDEKKKTRH